MSKKNRITKYHLYYKCLRHQLIFNVLKFIQWIRYDLISNYIYIPIASRVQLSTINRRITHTGYKDPYIYRLRRMQAYKINKEKNILYRKNMEIIAKMSEDTKIPQYLLLERNDVNNNKIIYKGDERYRRGEYSLLEPLYYIYKILPSFRQSVIAIHDLLIYFQERWQTNIGDRINEFIFEYYVRRILLVKIRGIESGKSNRILSKWGYQKYACKEKRLRIERNQNAYRRNKN